MVPYDKLVLNKLLDSYESSLLSTGKNERTIHIELRFIKKKLPAYFDESSGEYEQIHMCMQQLEDKNLITRERSAQDKRKIFVRLTTEQSNAYLKQHAQILKLLDDIIEKLGEEKTLEIIDTLNGISDVAGEIIK